MGAIHAPFGTEVECKIASVRADLFLQQYENSSLMTLPDATRNAGRCAAPRSSAEILTGAANPYHAREGSPPPGLRLLQAKLSRNSNQIARRRIRRFESTCPATQSVSNCSTSTWNSTRASRVLPRPQARPGRHRVDGNSDLSSRRSAARSRAAPMLLSHGLTIDHKKLPGKLHRPDHAKGIADLAGDRTGLSIGPIQTEIAVKSGDARWHLVAPAVIPESLRGRVKPHSASALG